jgi:hypothetical protein
MSIIAPALTTSSFQKAILLIAKTYTCSLLGIDALLVEVEVDLSSGLPYFAIVKGVFNTHTDKRSKASRRIVEDMKQSESICAHDS